MAEQYEKCTIGALAPVSLFDTMQGQDKVINNIPSYRGNYLILHDHDHGGIYCDTLVYFS